MEGEGVGPALPPELILFEKLTDGRVSALNSHPLNLKADHPIPTPQQGSDETKPPEQR